MIITISGMPGAGKSTVAKIIAKKLGYTHYSGGDLRGQMAIERGITIDELNEIGRKEPWTDMQVDDMIRKLGEEHDNLIFDSWIAFHFIPNSFKVFLDVDPKSGAQRIFNDQKDRADEAKKETIEDAMGMIKNRVECTSERYKKYYSIDFRDVLHYDLVIDTTNLTPKQVADKILDAAKEKF